MGWAREGMRCPLAEESQPIVGVALLWTNAKADRDLQPHFLRLMVRRRGRAGKKKKDKWGGEGGEGRKYREKKETRRELRKIGGKGKEQGKEIEF